MTRTSSITTRSAATVALLCALTPAAYAGTVYVANNGVDSTFCGFQVIGGFTCGAEASPCRSITCAIKEAEAGDTVLVGPGRYSGDLDGDGVIGERGEETPAAGCDCMVAVNKPVILVSSHGAASTVIDARAVDVAKNVLLMLNGGEFGRPGKGFTVTNTKRTQSDGIVIDGANVKVRGNQALSTHVFPIVLTFPRAGIRALFGGPILIEGNQVLGYWFPGIQAQGTGKTMRKNQVSVNFTNGIQAEGDSVVIGNIITATSIGIGLLDGAKAVGNAIYGIRNGIGIYVNTESGDRPFSGVIERNNLIGDGCGVYNDDVPVLNATNNYWGAASGPGPAPAAQVCNGDEGLTTTVTPFATTPFTVKAPIKP